MKCDLNLAVHRQEHFTLLQFPDAFPFCIEMGIQDKEQKKT